MRFLLVALTLLSLRVYATEPTAPQPADMADKTQILERVREAADELRARRLRAESCCRGNVKDCNISRQGARSLQQAKGDIESGAGKLGAQGAAVKLGDFADSLTDAGEAWREACTELSAKCSLEGDKLEKTLRAECPDCTAADLDPLLNESGRCPGDPRRPLRQDAGRPARPEAQAKAYPMPGPSGPALGSAGPEGRLGAVVPAPVVVENNNREWRDSLKDKPSSLDPQSRERDPAQQRKTHDGAKETDPALAERGEKLTGMADSFSKLAAGAGKSQASSDYQTASVHSGAGSEGTTGDPGTSPAAQQAPIGLFPSIGSVGMRALPPRQNVRPVGASIAPGTNAAIRPVQSSTTANGRGGVQFVSASAGGTGSFRGGPGSGGAPVAFNSGASGNQYKQPDITPSSMGGGPTGMNSAKPSSASGLAAYLPNAHMSPQSRGLAGSAAPSNPEILSQGKDVWQNMSMRLQYFCKIGRLYDCK